MRRIMLLVISVLLALFVAVPIVAAKSSNTNPSTSNTGTVVPPDKANYKKLSAQWWQWAFKTPAPDSPVTDPTGDRCAKGQTGNIWFLGGSFADSTGAGGGPIDRTCNVPAGKQLFFPVVNDESSTVEGDPRSEADGGVCPKSDSSLQECATALMDKALLDKYNTTTPSTMSVTVDGVQIQNLTPNNTPYRVASGPFKFTLPENNVDSNCTDSTGASVACPAGTSDAAGDGVYLLLAALPKGKHTITFGGTFLNGAFVENNKYTLNVS